MIKNIDHIAVIVPDIDAALAFWRDALGLNLTQVEAVPAQEVEVAFLSVGQGEIELVQPNAADSGEAKFLAQYGAGMHHIALEVEDLELMLARLKAKGVRLINETPVAAAKDRRAAFVHPESASGVLVELYESTLE